MTSVSVVAPEGMRTPAAVGSAQAGSAGSDIAAQATVELRSATSQVMVPDGFTGSQHLVVTG